VGAANIAAFFARDGTRRLLEKLEQAGVKLEEEVGEPRMRGPLAGMTFVITGTLPTWTREQAAEAIESSGGRVSDTVSKSTSYLVLGHNPGSKHTKALELGIPIIDEARLRALIADRS
jgi:DNA ligase (NAD+)